MYNRQGFFLLNMCKMDNIGGTLEKVVFFVMGMVHSDSMFVMSFPRECTEAFLEAHVRTFDFFRCVPNRISYDNMIPMTIRCP